MSPSSPVAAIYHVLQQVQANAEANAAIFQKNEAATRAALIDPVLRALGWDTANVRMVEPEKSLGNELRVDYLLNDAGGRPYVVIEAKSLGSSLDKYGYVGKILGYALTLNVQTVCITDGIHWHIHSNLQSGKSEPLTFTLGENSFLLAANQLIQWLDAAQSGHGIQPLPVVASNNVLQHDVSYQLFDSEDVIKQLVKRKTQPDASADFVELTSVHLPSLPPGQKPKALRLPDGTVKQIQMWKDILLEICRFALATNPHISVPLPDKAGKKTLLLSESKPITGSSAEVSYKNKPVFIYTHYNAADCIANAIYAAKQIPRNSKSTAIAIGF